MKFMYGYDAEDPERCFAELAGKGYTAVVAGDFSERAVAAAENEHIALYICYGAFGVAEGDYDNYALTADGKLTRWFGSGCPCASKNAEHNLTDAIRRAANCGADGIFVDGARFASPASAEGFDKLFSCFCVRCTSRAGNYGLSIEEMRYSAVTLMNFIQGRVGIKQLRNAENGLRQILAFRERRIADYMKYFTGRVHDELPGAWAGAFVFPRSLGWLVGQTDTSCASLDILSPMIYRKYKTAPGTATLNYEWAALQKALTENTGIPERAAASVWEEYTGVLLPYSKPEDIATHGFRPEDCVDEAAYKHDFVAPIIQLDDSKAGYLASLLYKAGSKSFGCFMYGANKE